MKKHSLSLAERAYHTRVPESFHEIHPDLKKINKYWFERPTYVFTVLFVAVLFALNMLDVITTRAVNYLLFVPIIFFLFALAEANRVNSAVALYASYIAKTEQPKMVEVVPYYTKSADSTIRRTYYIPAFEIRGEYPQFVKTYLSSCLGSRSDNMRYSNPGPAPPTTAKVWFDPLTHEAIMLDDGLERFWLQPEDSLLPTVQESTT